MIYTIGVAFPFYMCVSTPRYVWYTQYVPNSNVLYTHMLRSVLCSATALPLYVLPYTRYRHTLKKKKKKITIGKIPIFVFDFFPFFFSTEFFLSQHTFIKSTWEYRYVYIYDVIYVISIIGYIHILLMILFYGLVLEKDWWFLWDIMIPSCWYWRYLGVVVVGGVW